MGTTALMTKTQSGLGVLSVPGILDVLGLIPGVVCLCAIAFISTWSNYVVVGRFKLQHPEVYAIDDAGDLMFGRLGREFLGIEVCVYWIFCSGTGMLSTSIGLNAVSVVHGTCTAVFVRGCYRGVVLAGIRTLGKIKWTASVGLACVFVAVIIVINAVAVQDRPPLAPQDGPWKSDYKLVGSPASTQGISAVSAIVFSYAGTPGFFPIAAEMPLSSLICQAGVTAVYITVGIVISYDMSLPGLVASTIIVLRVSSKYIFVRLLRGCGHLTANAFIHWATWLGCTLRVNASAYLIASGIPIFGDVVSLIRALLGTLMSFQPMGCMWLYGNWDSGREWPKLGWALQAAWSILVIVLGSFLTASGASAWSCADNSSS
ncbi:hypothetical protein BDW71DRAFT_217849 [Aspergillus fruticulosus]